MKSEISFEKLSKENEIEKQKTSHDNCLKTKRKNERKRQIRHQRESKESRKKRHSKESKNQTKHQKKSKKSNKKQHHMILRSRTSRNRKQNFAFFFLTKKRKNTNIDTNIETLRRLTMIVTVLARSYFSTDNIAEVIDELNKRERRILT